MATLWLLVRTITAVRCAASVKGHGVAFIVIPGPKPWPIPLVGIWPSRNPTAAAPQLDRCSLCSDGSYLFQFQDSNLVPAGFARGALPDVTGFRLTIPLKVHNSQKVYSKKARS